MPPDHSGDRRDIPDRISGCTFHNRRKSPILPKAGPRGRGSGGVARQLARQAKPSLDMLRSKMARHVRARQWAWQVVTSRRRTSRVSRRGRLACL